MSRWSREEELSHCYQVVTVQIGLLTIKGEEAPDTDQIGVVSTSEDRRHSAECNCRTE